MWDPEILLSYGGHSPLALDVPSLLDIPEPQCGPKGRIVWVWDMHVGGVCNFSHQAPTPALSWLGGI